VSRDLRHYMTLVEGLSVSQPRPLMEASLRDMIGKVAQKYNDVSYQVLASVTAKALTAFSKNPPVQTSVQRILSVGKLAVRNRALLGILVGMVGTLIGMAASPHAAAQAAQQIDSSLAGNDIDQILHSLQQHGIHVDQSASLPDDVTSILQTLPPEVSASAQKAAKALRAIEDFKFHTGEQISSNSEVQDFRLEGIVTKHEHTYVSDIWSQTPDGQLTLAHAHVESHTVDGVYTHEHKIEGVQIDLSRQLGRLDRAQMLKVMNYITYGMSESAETDDPVLAEWPFSKKTQPAQAGDGLQKITSVITAKMPELSAVLTSALASKPDGKYKVVVGPTGTRVSPAA
jgi:hypothetical protein